MIQHAGHATQKNALVFGGDDESNAWLAGPAWQLGPGKPPSQQAGELLLERPVVAALIDQRRRRLAGGDRHLGQRYLPLCPFSLGIGQLGQALR